MIAKLIWRNLWRNSRRTLITMASITFAVMLAILMQSFQKGIFNNLIKNVVGYYSGYIQIHKAGYWDEQVLDNCFPMTDSLKNQLNQNEKIKQFVPRIETFVLASCGNTTKGCMLVGTDVEQENSLTQLKNKLIRGSYFNKNDNAVLIAEGLAARLNIDLNDTLVLFGQGYHGSMAAGKFCVKGILHLASPQMNDAFVYLPLSAAQYYLNAENMLTSISIGIDYQVNMQSVVNYLKFKTGSDYEVMDWEQMMPEISNHIKADGVSLIVFTGVLYLIIGFGFFGTILMMTTERKYEFGMLIAIGMKKSKLQIVLVFETLLMTFLGVFLGILITLPLVVYLRDNPLTMGGEMAKAFEQFGFEAIFPTEVDINIFYTQSFIVLIIALFAGLYPLWNVQKLDPVNAMKR
jgi:putative ABC transport system permease protein